MLRRLAGIIALSLGLFSLARLVLYWRYPHSFAGLEPWSVVVGFVEGIRFDTSAVLTFFALPILLFLLPLPASWRRRWQPLVLWVFYILSLAMLFVLAADVLYFRYVERHMFDELMLLGSDLSFVWGALASQWLALVVFVSFSLVAGLAWRRWLVLPPMMLYRGWRQGLSSLAFILLVAIGIRGSFSAKPLAPVDAFSAGSAALGQLRLNGVFTLWHGSVNRQANVPVPPPQSPEQMAAVLTSLGFAGAASYPFFQVPRTGQAPLLEKPNIVILLLESWGSFYVDSFGGQGFGATPNFDRLAAAGMRFPNFYANGSRSIEAIQAIMSSFPALQGVPTLGQGFEQMRIARLGEVVKSIGYDSLFYQSSDRRSFRLDAVAGAMGVDDYAGREDYPRLLDYHGEADPQFGWDYEGLMHLSDKLHRRDKPFVALYFTGTTHTPFVRPPQLAKDAAHGSDSEVGFLNTLRYADWSLGEFMAAAAKEPWFSNTVFVLTADHTFPPYRDFDYLSRHRVPLVLYAPELLPAVESSAVGSHLDILPTILDLIGYERPVGMAGRSLFAAPKGGYAILGGRYGTPTIVTAEGYLSHSLQQRLESVALAASCKDECFARLEAQLLVLQTSFYRAIQQNHWQPAAAVAKP